LPEKTVSDNMMLGNEIKNKMGVIDKRACDEKCGALLSGLEIEIPVNEKVAELSAAQKQLVEIAKSMVCRLSVLILDEPTSSLTDREMQYLVRILKQLKEKGVAIIFISHKLTEVKELCDSITVLRDGEVVRTERIEDADINSMVKWMVGRNIEDNYMPSNFSGEHAPLLEIKGLNSHVYGEVGLRDINITVDAGEIVGVFGLIGSGRTEIVRCIYGLRDMQGGEVRVGGKKIERVSPKKMIESGWRGYRRTGAMKVSAWRCP
jgi:ribose transport system ATP-binding protein